MLTGDNDFPAVAEKVSEGRYCQACFVAFGALLSEHLFIMIIIDKSAETNSGQ